MLRAFFGCHCKASVAYFAASVPLHRKSIKTCMHELNYDSVITGASSGHSSGKRVVSWRLTRADRYLDEGLISLRIADTIR